MARTWWYPDASDADLIVETLVTELTSPGGTRPLAGRLRDRALLASALALPRQPYYRTTIDKAAALFRSMVKNHPFADGNKRIGVLVVLLFLQRNGYEIDATNDGLAAFTLLLAASEPALPLTEIRRWIRANVTAANTKPTAQEPAAATS